MEYHKTFVGSATSTSVKVCTSTPTQSTLVSGIASARRRQWTSLAVRMQAQLADKGARLSMVVGDCDTHVDAHLNSCPTPELRNVIKCQDLNHMVKNIKKTLMGHQRQVLQRQPKGPHPDHNCALVLDLHSCGVSPPSRSTARRCTA